MFNAAALVFLAFIGFDAVTSAAEEEVRNPRRDLPIGIIGSLTVCTVLYSRGRDHDRHCAVREVRRRGHPVSLALQFAVQNWVAGFVDLGVILGMTTVILVMTYGQTRIIFAMSRDVLLPERLSPVHPVHATPYFATWTVGIVFSAIASCVPLNVLAELINIGTLAAFTLISVAVGLLTVRRCRRHRCS